MPASKQASALTDNVSKDKQIRNGTAHAAPDWIDARNEDKRGGTKNPH
ncbi:hypothetical protein ACGE24_07990 [Corynebacterium kroppenstedtii]